MLARRPSGPGVPKRLRTLIERDFEKAFEKIDALLAPVIPVPAFRIGEEIHDPLEMYLSDIYTVTANLSGVPSLSLPSGFTPSGFPVGMQILTRQFAESALLRFAEAYAQAFRVAAPPRRVQGRMEIGK